MAPQSERDRSWIGAIEAVVFDCFGTIGDFAEANFVGAFEEICRQSSLEISGRELWDRWLAHGREMAKERGRDPGDPLAGPEPTFVPFRDIWLPQFARTFSSVGSSADPAHARDLIVQKLSDAGCYPEAPGVLDALRGRYRLAMLSNADEDFLQACLSRNGIEFEIVVSSELARSYKPRPAIFDSVCRLLNLDASRVLYVGDSPVADVLGAHAAGMPVAWINRAGVELPEKMPVPELELKDLTRLPALLRSHKDETAPPLPA